MDFYLIASIIIALTILGMIFGYVVGRQVGYDYAQDEIEPELDKLADAVTERNKADLALRNAMQPHLENSQRYQLIRYYLEHDNGDIAFDAFYGAGAIRTAIELDQMLDTDLDERNVRLDLESFDQLQNQLNKKV
jgi:hypothetical protein